MKRYAFTMATSPNQLNRERWNLLITLRNSVSPLMDTLAFILAVYGFAIFGYVAATFASYLMSKVQVEEKKETLQQEVVQLRSEIRELKVLVKSLRTEIKR